MTATDTPTFAGPGVTRPAPVAGPIVNDPEPAEASASPLMDLLAEVADEVVPEDVIFPVTTRPGWAVRYSTAVTTEDMKRWEKAASRGTKRGEIDPFRFSLIGLASQCQAILRDGAVLYDDDHQPLTFGSAALWQLYGTQSAADTVRAFYSRDPAVGATFEALTEAMTGETVTSVDPTDGS